MSCMNESDFLNLLFHFTWHVLHHRRTSQVLTAVSPAETGPKITGRSWVGSGEISSVIDDILIVV